MALLVLNFFFVLTFDQKPLKDDVQIVTLVSDIMKLKNSKILYQTFTIQSKRNEYTGLVKRNLGCMSSNFCRMESASAMKFY